MIDFVGTVNSNLTVQVLDVDRKEKILHKKVKKLRAMASAVLTISEAWSHRALLYVASVFSSRLTVNVVAASAARDAVLAIGEKSYRQLPVIAKLLVPEEFAGRSVLQQAEVSRWLSFGFSDAPASGDGVSAVESQLQERSYVAGHSFTVADVVVRASLHRVSPFCVSVTPTSVSLCLPTGLLRTEPCNTATVFPVVSSCMALARAARTRARF
jgi:hypothetical protein